MMRLYPSACGGDASQPPLFMRVDAASADFHERVAPEEPQAVLCCREEHHDRLLGRSEIRASPGNDQDGDE